MVRLTPYHTGSTQVPAAPKRGPDIFTDLADYPYDEWAAKRGRNREPVVELILQRHFVTCCAAGVDVTRPPLDDPKVCGQQKIVRWPLASA